MMHPSDPPAAVLGRLSEFAKAATARAWWHPELASLRVSVGDAAEGARALARELGQHLEPGALELKAGLGPPRSSGWHELKLAAVPAPPPAPRKTLGAHVAQDWVNAGWLGMTPADPAAIAQGDPTRSLVPPPEAQAALAEPEPDVDQVAAEQALSQARAVDELLTSGDAALKAAARRGTGMGTAMSYGLLTQGRPRRRPKPEPEPAEEPEDPAVSQYHALDRLLSDEEAAAKAAAWWANLGR